MADEHRVLSQVLVISLFCIRDGRSNRQIEVNKIVAAFSTVPCPAPALNSPGVKRAVNAIAQEVQLCFRRSGANFSLPFRYHLVRALRYRVLFACSPHSVYGAKSNFEICPKFGAGYPQRSLRNASDINGGWNFWEM
jgi:hypothetical protein